MFSFTPGRSDRDDRKERKGHTDRTDQTGRNLKTSSSSSGDLESFTPYTLFTVGKKEVRFDENVTIVPAIGNGRIGGTVLEDPFVESTGVLIGSPARAVNEVPVELPLGMLAPKNLSATASQFTPSNLAELNATSVPDFTNHPNHAAIQAIQEQYDNALAIAVRRPRADEPVNIYDIRNTATTVAVRPHEPRAPAANGHANYGMNVVYGCFTVDQHPSEDSEAVTRYILLGNVSFFDFENEASGEGPLSQVKQSSLMSLVWGVKKNEHKGQYFFRFDSLMDALCVYDALNADRIGLNPNWTIDFIEAQHYHRGNGYDTPYWSTKEGEIRLTVYWKNKHLYLEDKKHEGLHALRYEVCKMAGTVGAVAASCINYLVHDHLVVIQLEMQSIKDADRLVRWTSEGIPFNSKVCGVCRIVGEHVDPACHPLGTSANTLHTPLHHGRHRFAYDGANNKVVPQQIMRHLDVRTTVMLRNIPNKLQAFDFKRMLDVACCGKYDFFYLRVDFNNQCNVGYAFVNFETPADILPFYYMFAGKQWNMYNSDKVAQICYATIQGKECLVERFRNSSVQTQWPPFRAKIFSTASDNVPGQPIGNELSFPPANNHTKLKRSLDNVLTVGLYPPRGENKRMDRQRRSQFDRGTPAAYAEERMYELGHHGRAGDRENHLFATQYGIFNDDNRVGGYMPHRRNDAFTGPAYYGDGHRVAAGPVMAPAQYPQGYYGWPA